MEDLRNELNQQEIEAKIRRSEQADKEKRIRFREMMQQAERESLALKQRQKAEEIKIEAQFKQIMMDKFAEEERIDQMNMQKKRMKKLQHRREVNSIIIII